MTLYLLTAPSGAGKTTFCAALADQARAAGWDVAGILCPPVFENGIKTGILVQDLRTRETRPLAISSHFPLPAFHSSPLPTFHSSPLSTFHLPLGNWLFDSSALAWGNEIFAAALPCDLFIVDELGPLELVRGKGWQNALAALRQPAYKIAVAIVRPSLVETARELFPQSQTLSLPQDASNFFLSLQQD